MGDLFGYSRDAQRFRDLSTGRWVSERAVRDAVDRTADLASRRMGELTARFRAGELTAVEWQTGLLETIKSSQVAAALAAYGGRDAMSPSRWGTVGQLIRTEYAYLRQFTADVLEGRQRWNGRMDARARMYGQATRRNYEAIRRRESASAGLQFERNVLHPADHCQQCLNQTALGSVPIGTLIPVGMRACRSGCRCTLSFSRQREMDEAAA